MIAASERRPPLTPTAILAVDVVVFTFKDESVARAWQTLVVRTPGEPARYALPGVLVNAEETFDAAARRALTGKAGLEPRDWYLEQLATFGNPSRDSRARVASVAHVALARGEDLVHHSAAAAASVEWWPVSAIQWDALAFDHAAILREAIARVRGKVRYTWVLFQLLPPEFTMSQLRAAYAAIRGPEVMHLSTSNVRKLFRRLIELGALVPIGERAEAAGPGRPGDLFRFTGPLTGTWARELPW
jgi:8-oxo-dGTP diphosphatase